MANKMDSLVVEGRLTCKSIDLPSDCVTDAKIPAGANLDPTKMGHQHRIGVADNNATTTATFTRSVYSARGPGKVKDFVAGNVGPCAGAATIVVDIKKNNVSILSSTITLDNTNTARVAEVGTLNPALTTLAALDLIEITATATAGGGTLGTGFFAYATIQEDPVI